jgi:hypothetical protein
MLHSLIQVLMKIQKQLILIIAILIISASLRNVVAQVTGNEPKINSAITNPATSKTTPEKSSFDRSVFDQSNIVNQFDYIMEKSNRYEDFKVVKATWFIALKAHVADTLKVLKRELRESHSLISIKGNTIDSLKTDLKNTNDNLASTFKEKNSVSFLGIPMEKHHYNTFIWSIIAGMAICLLAFIVLFRRSNTVATQTKLDLMGIKDEFDAFRKNALEREGKLARKYLDELNKYKNKT